MYAVPFLKPRTRKDLVPFYNNTNANVNSFGLTRNFPSVVATISIPNNKYEYYTTRDDIHVVSVAADRKN